MLKARIFAVLSIFFLLSAAGRAEHIIGGEMFYECTGPNTYLFTMKLFRDCNSTGAFFDNPATFGIFNENNQLIEQRQAFVENIQLVNTDLETLCIAIPPDICVQEGTYSFILTLPNNSQMYQVVYQRCCRNGTIQNLINPGAQGLSILSTIPPASDAECNSSPFFNNFPPPVLCAQEPINFDHSATDPDGDSLVYSLCSPFLGASQDMPMPVPPSNPPYNTVIWGANYSDTEPLNGLPELSIDPVSGLLTGTAVNLGQFVVGVCVEEWRDGVLLSTNTRDFQFNVAFCEQTTQAIVVVPEIGDLCQGLTFTFDNQSNPDNVFQWDFGDPNTTADISSLYNPSYTYPDTGVYTVSLVTNPGFFCSDTLYIDLPLFYTIDVSITLSQFECVDGQQLFSFEADGDFDQVNSTVMWEFGPGAIPLTANGLSVNDIAFPGSGEFPVTVLVLNNICTAVDQVFVTVQPEAIIEINEQSVFCNGLTHSFSQTSSNANTYVWNFGVAGTDGDVSTAPNPNFTFPNQGVYTVTVTANGANNCQVTDSETFDIRPLLFPQVGPIPVVCFNDHEIDLQAGGSFTSGANFSWQLENALPATSALQNPQNITFPSPGTFQAMLTISENGCSRSDSIDIQIHANPLANFEATPLFGCAPLDCYFSNLSSTQSTSVAYTWDYGDGNRAGATGGIYTYTDPGIYSVTLEIENLNGCLDSDIKTIYSYVEVVPSPQAGFKIDPIMLSVIDPVVEIVDASIGALSVNYYFDEQEFNEFSFSHILENVVPQSIRQTVMNEYGCIDEAEGEIFISDHIIFIPNAFTPDGDGLNDIFVPVTSGVVKYEMHIMDRWGREIYSSNDVQRGWDGSGIDPTYYSQSGLYQYIIRITDHLGWNFDYTGFVSVVR